MVNPVEKVSDRRIAFRLALTGLQGGHSGIDINLGRGNAIKLLNRILFNAIEKTDMRLCCFHGGSVRNAIPREAFATVVVPDEYKDEFREFISIQESILRQEYQIADPGLTVSVEETEIRKGAYKPGQNNLISAIYACPNGVIRMSDRVKGVVETSNNLAVLRCENGDRLYNVFCAVRLKARGKIWLMRC